MATPTTLPATFVAGNVLTAAQMNDLRGAFRVLQTVSTAKTDTFTTTSATFTDVTGLTATITPSATSSKILVIAQVAHGGVSATSSGNVRISGGNAATYIGNTAGSRVSTVFGGFQDPTLHGMIWANSIVYLDSPATTSATTYSVQARIGNAGTVYINRGANDTDNSATSRGASSITVMEISA